MHYCIECKQEIIIAKDVAECPVCKKETTPYPLDSNALGVMHGKTVERIYSNETIDSSVVILSDDSADYVLQLNYGSKDEKVEYFIDDELLDDLVDRIVDRLKNKDSSM